MESQKWIAEQRFRCVPPEGGVFDLTIKIGEPMTVRQEDGPSRSFGKCKLALLPLAADKWVSGGNQFQAMCLALDHIRVVFRVFLAEGGRIYWEDTNSHVDVDSVWFAPLPDAASLSLVGAARA